MHWPVTDTRGSQISHGNWAGKQLADADFLSWSTTLMTPFAELNPTAFRAAGEPMHWGYGRLWWVWDPSLYPGGTSMGPFQGGYSAMGTGGQYITVFPQQDLVVVHKVYIDANYTAICRCWPGMRRSICSSTRDATTVTNALGDYALPDLAALNKM